MDQDAGALSRGIPDSQTEAGVGGCSFLSLCWHQGNFVWVMKEKKRKVLHFFLCSEWMFCTISSSCSQRHLSDYFSALHSAEQLRHDTTEPWTMSRYQPALLLWQGRSGFQLKQWCMDSKDPQIVPMGYSLGLKVSYGSAGAGWCSHWHFQ